MCGVVGVDYPNFRNFTLGAFGGAEADFSAPSAGSETGVFRAGVDKVSPPRLKTRIDGADDLSLSAGRLGFAPSSSTQIKPRRELPVDVQK